MKSATRVASLCTIDRPTRDTTIDNDQPVRALISHAPACDARGARRLLLDGALGPARKGGHDRRIHPHHARGRVRHLSLRKFGRSRRRVFLAGRLFVRRLAISAVTLDKVDGAFAITTVHLDVTARIPGADPAAFQTAAANAKAGCPVSKLFNAKITMDAKLED